MAVSTQRVMAVAMIVIGASVLMVMTNEMVFPLMISACAAIGLSGRFQVSLSRERRLLVILALFLVFALKWRFLPSVGRYQSSVPLFSIVLDQGLAHATGQALLAFLVLLLFLRQDRLPPTLPLYAALAVVLFGNIPYNPSVIQMINEVTQKRLFHYLSLGLAVVTALYYASRREQLSANGDSGRRRFARGALLAGTLACALSLGSFTSGLVYRHGRELDQALGNMFYRLRMPSSPGFSRTARPGKLASVKGDEGNATALRIFSEFPPSYFRGMAFDECLGSQWQARAKKTNVMPAEPPAGAPTPGRGRNAFDLRPAPGDAPSGWWSFEIYPSADLENTIFGPLGTAFVYAPTDELRVDSHGVAEGVDLPRGAAYTDIVPRKAPRDEIRSEDRMLLTELPKGLDPRIHELARGLFQGRESDADKIAAVTGYFRQNYEYNIGIEIPQDQNPLTYFLLERPPAHCEFFACGAAVLLRCGGVPARYVTGFMVNEKNTLGGYWVARSKDGHAWVEAYDGERGWVTVEATPGSGVPSDSSSKTSQLWEYIKFRIQLLREALRNAGVMGLLVALAAMLWGLLKSLLMGPGGAVLAVVLLAVLGRRYLRARGKRATVELDPLLILMRRLLGRMDARLRKAGYSRGASETLHGFAGRLAENGLGKAAEWYRAYAAARYGHSLGQDVVERLDRDMPGDS